ncbi:MAG: hypothetical protein LBG65_00870 [Puniceicoccales bacterium]|jgi:hypothetical protein|nr:hypothetical protein [Puniceicoccales bacterium]
MRDRFSILAAWKNRLAAVLTACLCIMAFDGLPAAGEAKAGADKRENAAASPARYTRFVDIGGGKYAMQLAVRAFAPARGNGPRVLLVSAIHIGSESYYRRLQQILDNSKLVLFEGVGDVPRTSRDRPGAQKAADGDAPGEAGTDDTLYDHLAAAAGLISQTKGIQYDRPHFHNCDLSMREMRERLEAESRQGGKTAREAREALQLMREVESALRGAGGFPLLVAQGMGRLMAGNPGLRTLFLCKIATVEDAQEPFSGPWAPPGLRRLGRMILHERNDAVLDSLSKRLKHRRRPANIAIFYGAAHMRGLEEGLVKRHGYRLRETEWVTAFTLDPAAAGLPPAITAAIARMAQATPK